LLVLLLWKVNHYGRLVLIAVITIWFTHKLFIFENVLRIHKYVADSCLGVWHFIGRCPASSRFVCCCLYTARRTTNKRDGTPLYILFQEDWLFCSYITLGINQCIAG
jgi:hypothetical protein